MLECLTLLDLGKNNLVKIHKIIIVSRATCEHNYHLLSNALNTKLEGFYFKGRQFRNNLFKWSCYSVGRHRAKDNFGTSSSFHWLIKGLRGCYLYIPVISLLSFFVYNPYMTLVRKHHGACNDPRLDHPDRHHQPGYVLCQLEDLDFDHDSPLRGLLLRIRRRTDLPTTQLQMPDHRLRDRDTEFGAGRHDHAPDFRRLGPALRHVDCSVLLRYHQFRRFPFLRRVLSCQDALSAPQCTDKDERRRRRRRRH